MNSLRDKVRWMIAQSNESSIIQSNDLANDISMTFLLQALEHTQLIENEIVFTLRTQLLKRIYDTLNRSPFPVTDNIAYIGLNYIRTDETPQDWGRLMVKIDTQINDFFINYTNKNNFGFVNGTGGMLHYLGHRQQRDEVSKNYFEQNLTVFLKSVKETFALDKIRHHSLDFSRCHGLVGSLLLLTTYVEHNDEIKDLIINGCNLMLLLRQEVDATDNRFRFFPTGLEKGKPIFDNETSWMIGDLNQALLLYRASKTLGVDYFFDIAQLVGLHTLTVAANERNHVSGIGLENGLANLVLNYQRLYDIDPQPAYKKAFGYWQGKLMQAIENTQVFNRELIEAVTTVVLQQAKCNEVQSTLLPIYNH